MNPSLKPKNLPTTPASYNDPAEKNRLLMQYAGIFKNHIKEVGEKLVPRMKKLKNFSR